MSLFASWKKCFTSDRFPVIALVNFMSLRSTQLFAAEDIAPNYPWHAAYTGWYDLFLISSILFSFASGLFKLEKDTVILILTLSIAALNYGYRVIALPITLITTALSTAVTPYFSKMVACDDWAGVRNTLKRYMLLVFAFTVPLTGLLLVFSQLIVQILFQRGSFTNQDTQLVAQIQNSFAFQIPFYTGCILMVRLILSMKLNYILMWVSGFNLLNNIVLNYLFLQWIGIKGIALSTSCVYLFSFLFLLFFVKNKLAKVFLNKTC